jgi:hypothetical protein
LACETDDAAFAVGGLEAVFLLDRNLLSSTTTIPARVDEVAGTHQEVLLAQLDCALTELQEQALAVAGLGWNHYLMSPAGSGKAQFRGGQGACLDRHPARSKWRWLMLAWLFGLGLVVVSGLLPSAVGYLVILGTCVFLGSVLGAHTGDPSGLRDHRQ